MSEEYVDYVAALCIDIIRRIYAGHPGVEPAKARIFAIYDLVSLCNSISRGAAAPAPWGDGAHSLCAAQWILEVGLTILANADPAAATTGTQTQQVIYLRECSKSGGRMPLPPTPCAVECEETPNTDPFVVD